MVKDRKVSSNLGHTPFYALKVQKSAEHYTEAAMDEVELLDCIAAERKKSEAVLETQGTLSMDSDNVTALDTVDHSRHVAILHDSFFHTGPNGRHMCMIFSMLGCNLLSVIKAYNYRGIPIPAVKKMIKGITKGLDFLHRKCEIIHTDLKPENVLLQFPSQIEKSENSNEVTDSQKESHNNAAYNDEYPNMTTEELELALRNPKTPTEERKKIRKRLTKRRQKDKKELHFRKDDIEKSAENDNGILLTSSGTISDAQYESIMKEKNSPSPNVKVNSHDRVLARISHNPFVMRNFSSQLISPQQSETMANAIDDMVKVLRPNKSEINAHFRLCSAQMNSSRNRPSVSGGGGGGVAEVTFLLRAFVPEGEIADNISALLGIPWERSEETRHSREW